MTQAEYRKYQKQKQDEEMYNSGFDSVGSVMPWYSYAKEGESIGKGFVPKETKTNAAGGQKQYGKSKNDRAADSFMTPTHEQASYYLGKKDYAKAAGSFLGLQGMYAKDKEKDYNKFINEPAPATTPVPASSTNQRVINGAAAEINQPQSSAPTGNLASGYRTSGWYGGGGGNGGYTGMSNGYGGGDTYRYGGGSGSNYGNYIQGGIGIGQSIAGYQMLKENQMPEDYSLTPEMKAALRRAEEMSKEGYTAAEISSYLQMFQRLNNARSRMATERAGQNLSNATSAATNYGSLGQLNQMGLQDAQMRRNNIRYSDQLQGRAQSVADMNNARHWWLWNKKEDAAGQLMQQGMNNFMDSSGSFAANNNFGQGNPQQDVGYRYYDPYSQNNNQWSGATASW